MAFTKSHKKRTEVSSSLSSGMSVEMMMTTTNNRRTEEEEEEQDDWFTPKQVLAYCMIIGLISVTLSIFIDSLIVLSVAVFVFDSITLWYMFGDKFHRGEERRIMLTLTFALDIALVTGLVVVPAINQADAANSISDYVTKVIKAKVALEGSAMEEV